MSIWAEPEVCGGAAVRRSPPPRRSQRGETGLWPQPLGVELQATQVTASAHLSFHRESVAPRAEPWLPRDEETETVMEAIVLFVFWVALLSNHLPV